MNRQQLEQYLQKNPFVQIKNIVFDLISEEIITLKLKPGENINISQIAEDLNISITPVREAIIKLIDYGFIKRYPHKKGYYVASFDIDDIIKVFYARKTIESKAAYLCAQNKKCPNIEKLTILADAQKNSFYDNTAVSNDFEFHKLLVFSCGNNYLIEFYNSIERKALRYLKSNLVNLAGDYYSKHPGIESLATQHTSIVNAIMPELAEKETANHIETALKNALYFYNSNKINI
ncbi:MAG: GntR family transcriptional regulator [Eubacteriaceae bacterium]|nr:GntR family transcriptional regulator [Eubacteriaceae bacterium]